MFPVMKPVPLSLLMPSVHADDISFLESILVMNPSKRLSSEKARNHVYFQRHPLPAVESSLLVVEDDGTRGIDRRIIANTTNDAVSVLLSNAIKLTV